jgi:hypothetical protein
MGLGLGAVYAKLTVRFQPEPKPKVEIQPLPDQPASTLPNMRVGDGTTHSVQASMQTSTTLVKHPLITLNTETDVSNIAKMSSQDARAVIDRQLSLINSGRESPATRIDLLSRMVASLYDAGRGDSAKYAVGILQQATKHATYDPRQASNVSIEHARSAVDAQETYYSTRPFSLKVFRLNLRTVLEDAKIKIGVIG